MERTVDVSALPAKCRAGFQELAHLLHTLGGDNVLALIAFGGWLFDDPFFAAASARSVTVLRRFDLALLDQLGKQGARLGKRGLRAPLMMTPEYVAASRDVFPLEFLEIQSIHAVLCGDDHFSPLRFEARDVRLQCERELKSELIQLRQGLVAAAGDRRPLADLCRNSAERAGRVLRGVLYLRQRDLPRLAADLVAGAAEETGLSLAALREVTAGRPQVDLDLFERLYGDLTALADYVNALP